MLDDDIEIVEKKSADQSISGIDDICQLCSTNLRGLDDAERKDHYNRHDSGRPTTRARRGKPKRLSLAGSSRQKTPPMRPGKNTKNVAEDVFWYPTQAEEPPHNYTPGVLSVLKEALKQSHRKGSIQRAVLCYERTPHIYRESFDTNWGCGYRNFLMTCAALMDQQFQTVYFPHLDSPSPPGVRNLQHWIEDAWKNGYDELGASELGRNLVGTNKRIGTAELYVAFTSRRIPCILVDFDIQKSPKGFDTLIEWVVNYFTEKHDGDVHKILLNTSPVMATRKMPVIMQFDGHSVTIVGYELTKNDKFNLFVLDPSSKIPNDVRQAALNARTNAGWESSSPFPLGKSKHREQSKSPVPRKRSRTGEGPDGGVVSVPDSDDEEVDDARRTVALKSALNPDKVITAFRLTKHKKKQEYQLLHFTMGDPLSDLEQNDRKVVLVEC